MNYGIKPDIVSMAKALGGGMPIGAICATAEVAKAFTAGSHEMCIRDRSSTDSKVASVSSGKVKAKKTGTATITAKIGSKKRKCQIKIKDQRALYEKVLPWNPIFAVTI